MFHEYFKETFDVFKVGIPEETCLALSKDVTMETNSQWKQKKILGICAYFIPEK